VRGSYRALIPTSGNMDDSRALNGPDSVDCSKRWNKLMRNHPFLPSSEVIFVLVSIGGNAVPNLAW
jgi:hypothetical protein